MGKYFNNIVKQDYRFIKKKIDPIHGFKTLDSAEKLIAGIEIMHMIHKGQIEGIRCVQ
ncbi:MAG: DDE-type integrase/transposase/recombinase [Candidatus Delongbacteria bacterium]|nr:DDE-type integrase/transposase/recombinase [Candidatus Delongbacteria bacterium]